MQEAVSDDFCNGKARLGGFNEMQVVALIKEGKIGYGTQVWRKGLDAWCNVEQTELRSYLEEIAPPPLSGDQVINTLVWILAFMPLISLFVEAIIAYALYGDTYK